MTKRMYRIVAVLAGLATSATFAQTTNPAAAADGPAATTATTAPPPPATGAISAEALAAGVGYGDWVLRCQQLPPGTEPARQCEILQTLMLQGQTQPVAQMAIDKIRKTDPLRVTVALPPNVFLGIKATIGTDANDPSPAELTWRRCLPGACIADKELNDAQLQRWQAVNAPGVMAWSDGQNQRQAISVSFRGLDQALDALAKEQ